MRDCVEYFNRTSRRLTVPDIFTTEEDISDCVGPYDNIVLGFEPIVQAFSNTIDPIVNQWIEYYRWLKRRAEKVIDNPLSFFDSTKMKPIKRKIITFKKVTDNKKAVNLFFKPKSLKSLVNKKSKFEPYKYDKNDGWVFKTEVDLILEGFK